MLIAFFKKSYFYLKFGQLVDNKHEEQKTSTSLKQSVIISAENSLKGSQHPSFFNALQEVWRTFFEDYLKKLQDSLPERDQTVSFKHVVWTLLFAYMLYLTP